MALPSRWKMPESYGSDDQIGGAKDEEKDCNYLPVFGYPRCPKGGYPQQGNLSPPG